MGLLVTLVLLSLGFLAINLIGPRTRLNLLHQRVTNNFFPSIYFDNNHSEMYKNVLYHKTKIVVNSVTRYLFFYIMNELELKSVYTFSGFREKGGIQILRMQTTT